MYSFPWKKAMWVAVAFVATVIVGTLAYQYFTDGSWVDSFYNSSMIISGMGPTADLETNAGKIFIALFALYSGLLLIAIIGVFVGDFVTQMTKEDDHY